MLSPHQMGGPTKETFSQYTKYGYEEEAYGSASKAVL
jgi:hypothetical protein